MLGYLIPVLIFALGFWAISRWGRLTTTMTPPEYAERRKWQRILYIVWGALALITFASLVGVFGHIDGVTPTDPLLNR